MISFQALPLLTIILYNYWVCVTNNNHNNSNEKDGVRQAMALRSDSTAVVQAPKDKR